LSVIIFNGPPGSGKDAACEFFTTYGFEHLSFKEELFKETFKFFNVSKEWFMQGYNDRSTKEKNVPELQVNGVMLSRRDAMIYVSESYIKPKYGTDYFGLQSSKHILPNRNYCFSDGGFASELIPIINKIGLGDICIVQLTRDGCDFSSDSRRYIDGEMIQEYVICKKTEISKMHVLTQKFPIRTYRIHNNGNIEQFKTILHKIYEKESDEQQGSKA
jgi:hypothetical protein